MDNPFITKSYETKELFCDREDELQQLLRNVTGHTDTTLISQRRIGKTGLILRLFDELSAKRPDIQTIYMDIFASQNLDDFIKMMVEAAMRAFRPKSSILDKLMIFIKALRPQISFDPITGDPLLQISYQTTHEKEYTLRGLFEFLDSQNTPIVMAIDEFQQIREYPEQNMEALLRTYIQQTKNITFIFCGSKKHIMADIFTNARKPFYSCTAFITLNKIPLEKYKAFIVHLFNQKNRNIQPEATNFILEWTRRHTFYTQQLCHTIYDNGATNIGLDDVKNACAQLLQQGESVYLQYRQMLTEKQWRFLIAIAKEGSVIQITAGDFLRKHKIGTSSSVQRLTDSVCEKGLLNAESSLHRTEYTVNDVFFSHWLERL
ncbi:MAG: ATP-binding protein [Bacteroidales bacterium]|nr:ATP-binding protein [Bacteroidales bacterium]